MSELKTDWRFISDDMILTDVSEDVALKISGNFGSAEEKKAYLEMIMNKLNTEHTEQWIPVSEHEALKEQLAKANEERVFLLSKEKLLDRALEDIEQLKQSEKEAVLKALHSVLDDTDIMRLRLDEINLVKHLFFKYANQLDK